ncbi:hypothetical protein BJ912DRAFT_1066377 [Pholiota molesta]|nr:hypothetical protein BJ912DRAFT_1066377 [Pholiota molesta]
MTSAQFAVYQAFRTIVPEAKDRIPLDRSTAIYPILCYAPFVFLAYLTRRPDTYHVRLLLLPSTVTLILVAAYRFTWTTPELNVYNWGQCGLWAAVALAKSLDFALTEEGMLKIGECRPGIKKGKDKSNGVEIDSMEDEHKQHPYIATWLYDATARTLRIPHSYPEILHQKLPHSRHPRISAQALSRSRFAFGRDDVLSQLPLAKRYLVSTAIHMITGYAILAGFHMVYDLVTLIAVGLLDGSPTSWPPVMDQPWHADSMHRFWGKDWHQLLRRTFLVFGGFPGKWIGGNIGMLFGMFLASGLFHECAMYSMSRGFDHSATVFFGAQAFVLLFERMWRRYTGRRISGIPGRLWVYFNMFVCAQPTVDAWHRRGLGGGMVIPPALSPTRWIFLPLAKRLLENIQH